MDRLSLEVAVETRPFASPFRISGHVFTETEVVVVTLRQGENRGRGEASGVYYLGDDAAHMTATLERHRDAITAGLDREELRALMPAGGARNAVDSALWELESDQKNMPVWQLAGLERPEPAVTAFTLSADRPDEMARAARQRPDARALKLKLTGELELDSERVRAVRAARPEVWMAVDANQGFEIGELDRLMAVLGEAEVALLEQPLRRGSEADLEGYRSPIPIAADESLLSSADLPGLVGRFDVANIKLDKCGGLTEALHMVRQAERLGLGVMVGNMVGTSLAMAPAFLLAPFCQVVDLDGPTFLAQDREPGMEYEDGHVWCDSRVWGPQSFVEA